MTVTPSQEPAVSTPSAPTSAPTHRARHHVVATVRHRHKVAKPARRHRAPAHHPSPVTRPAPPVVAPHVAARAAPNHNNGAMLLAGALVLLLLAGASLVLLRVANRLQREIAGSAA
ncbi:MAG TPA: hypothetical protein VMF14_01490 [Solirubrobacteraceae bacterium]|nr:hypothetical protein [Solirubrobacteraceae bacterium]